MRSRPGQGNSFRAMVDSMGGVEVCVPRGGYHDPYSRLNLRGGLHLLTYNQALSPCPP